MATDYQSILLDTDPAPHSIVMCRMSDGGSTLPSVDVSLCTTITSTIGEDARAFMDVEVGVDSDVLDDYCYNDDCDCQVGTDDYSDSLCNWDDSAGSAIECTGSGMCVNDTSVECSYTDEDDDGNDDGCEAEGVTGVCTTGLCSAGPSDGNPCSSAFDCFPNYCHANFNSDGLTRASCQLNGDSPAYTLSSGSASDAIAVLSEIFGRIYGIVAFVDDGYGGVSSSSLWPRASDYEDVQFGSFEHYSWNDNYKDIKDGYADWIWDSRALRDNAEKYVPQVRSIGECEGSVCYEGDEGKFTVNEMDSGDIEGEGSKRASLSFFTYADSEQMPIRRIVVDWGDDFTALTGSMPWPTGSQSGSTAVDNFYKNQRGLSGIFDTEECSSDPDIAGEFGKYSSACSTSYIAFTHDYTCTVGQLEALSTAGDRACEFNEDGRLLNSPCVEGSYCVFQPRVHVMDNWGWCTGYCDAGADGTTGCYSGSVEGESQPQNECDIVNCPSEGLNGSCDDFGTTKVVNPWINYDGAIYILAE